MNAPTSERRRRRSADVITALHYQLAHARQDGGFDALVLADETGALIAGAGAWPVCEELAAFAPLLAGPAGDPKPVAMTDSVKVEASEIKSQVALRLMHVDGSEVLFVARGPEHEGRQGSIRRAITGCRRILGAESAETR
ncbi:MAG: hypothetical protein U0165_15040 [Polyangiaceae bacterium]